jgi:hypothetical protein
MDNTETLATLDTQDTGQKLEKAEGAMKKKYGMFHVQSQLLPCWTPNTFAVLTT